MQLDHGRPLKSEINLLKLLKQLSGNEVSVECPSCKLVSLISSVVRLPRLDGSTSVGWACTHCGLFVESYRTNRVLDQMQGKLDRYMGSANKSDKHFERYKRYQARYQAQFDQLNNR